MKIKYFILSIFILSIFCPCSCQEGSWIEITEGLAYRKFQVAEEEIEQNSSITIVKIDPDYFDFKLLSISELGDNNRNVKQWVNDYNLVLAFNAGMYETDYSSNVGYMKNYDHVNNPEIRADYYSFAAFNPIDDKSEPFRIFDSDEVDIKKYIASYNTVIQNLRLIKRPGINVWSDEKREWNEIALGEDISGNMLLIFSSTPFNMPFLNDFLLSLPIDLECAQHLEGGPIASFYLKFDDFTLEGFYSHGRESIDNDSEAKFFNLPNVIGIIKK